MINFYLRLFQEIMSTYHIEEDIESLNAKREVQLYNAGNIILDSFACLLRFCSKRSFFFNYTQNVQGDNWPHHQEARCLLSWNLHFWNRKKTLPAGTTSSQQKNQVIYSTIYIFTVFIIIANSDSLFLR